jgi:hypothetical protein
VAQLNLRRLVDQVNKLADECAHRGVRLENVLVFTQELDKVLALELEDVAADVFADPDNFPPGKAYPACVVFGDGATGRLLTAVREEVALLRRQLAGLGGADPAR